MQPSLSVYLNAVRFAAAFVVFLSHLAEGRFSGGVFWPMRALGSPAVDVFFVLSGFVIDHAAARPGANGWDYGIDRAARILSVAIPAVALTFLFDTVGALVAPDLYREVDQSAQGMLAQALNGVLFLNESWAVHVRIGSNDAYWSLAYEVWYYVAFGFAVFGRGHWRSLGLAGALLVAGPRIALLFPLWLLGVATRRCCIGQRWAPPAGLALAAVTLLGGTAWLGWAGIHHQLSGAPIFARAPADLGVDYAVGFVFALTIIGIHHAAPLLDAVARRISAAVAGLASITLTLYALHLPALGLLRSLSPWPAASWQNQVFLIAGVLLLVVAVAGVTEFRRKVWRDGIASLVAWVAEGRTMLQQRLIPEEADRIAR